MLKTTLFIVGLIWINSLAFAKVDELTGKYKSSKDVVVYFESQSSCEETGGSWRMDEESCTHESFDELIIKKHQNRYSLQLTTVGANFHTCSFQGQAEFKSDALISRKLSEEYDVRSGRLKEVMCEVTVKRDGRYLKVLTNNHCQGFCGANAQLDVKDLQKMNKADV